MDGSLGPFVERTATALNLLGNGQLLETHNYRLGSGGSCGCVSIPAPKTVIVFYLAQLMNYGLNSASGVFVASC